MALLHPDKIVGVANAVLRRPRTPRPSVEVAAQRAHSGFQLRPLVHQPQIGNGSMIANLAYHLNARHEAGALNRMARAQTDAAQQLEQAYGQQAQANGVERQSRPQRPSVGQARPAAPANPTVGGEGAPHPFPININIGHPGAHPNVGVAQARKAGKGPMQRNSAGPLRGIKLF